MSELVRDAFKNRVGCDRISDRQVNELIGIARGVAADGEINSAEVNFLAKWLAANVDISGQPVIRTLYVRVQEILSDGIVDDSEKSELLDTLNQFANRDFELGEVLKPTTLPLCKPAPSLTIHGKHYCFTGTFLFGDRRKCQQATVERGGTFGSLSLKTNVLVIGAYATDSWKHSSFGNKILDAVEMREKGRDLNIVSEEHWQSFL